MHFLLLPVQSVVFLDHICVIIVMSEECSLGALFAVYSNLCLPFTGVTLAIVGAFLLITFSTKVQYNVFYYFLSFLKDCFKDA